MALGRKEKEESGLMWFPSLQPTSWLTESHASSHSLKILTRENALKQTARTLRHAGHPLNNQVNICIVYDKLVPSVGIFCVFVNVTLVGRLCLLGLHTRLKSDKERCLNSKFDKGTLHPLCFLELSEYLVTL